MASAWMPPVLSGSTPTVRDHRFLEMNLIRRSLDLEPDTDARLRSVAAECGQDEGRVMADAVVLLDSVVDIAGPDIAEDRLRLEDFRRSPEAVPLGAAKAWVASWDTGRGAAAPECKSSYCHYLVEN
jgi:hypothetical protein